MPMVVGGLAGGGTRPAVPFGADLRTPAPGKVYRGLGSEKEAAAAIAALPCADRGRRLVEAVKISALALKFGPHDLRGDRDVVAAAVRGNWRALEFAPDEFKADRTVVLAALSGGGEDALRFAAVELRRDPEMKAAAGRASASQQLQSPNLGGGAAALPAGTGVGRGVGVAASGAGAGGARNFTTRRVAPPVQMPENNGPATSKVVPISYAWLEGGALELEVPRDLGAPLGELLRPGAELGPGIIEAGVYLRVSFPGSKNADWKPSRHFRLPVPCGVPAGRPVEFQAANTQRPQAEAVEERRVDPEDQLFVTLASLREKYFGRYNEAELREYWDEECEPLDEQLWLRHEEVAMASWTLRPAGLSFRCMSPPASTVASQADVLASELQDRGYGIVDGFLQAAEADAVHSLMRRYWADKRFKAGMIGIGIQKTEVRGDLTVNGELGSLPEVLKPLHHRIKQLVAQLSKTVDCLNQRGPVECEPPMMAVYPGGGTCYKRHFDGLEGPQKSGLLQPRVCTLIAYFNPFWCEDHGGQLRLYPDDVAGPPDVPQPPPRRDERVVSVDPLHGRLLAFLCQGRNAHEVMPSWRPRFAVTTWVRELRQSTGGWEGLAP